MVSSQKEGGLRNTNRIQRRSKDLTEKLNIAENELDKSPNGRSPVSRFKMEPDKGTNFINFNSIVVDDSFKSDEDDDEMLLSDLEFTKK